MHVGPCGLVCVQAQAQCALAALAALLPEEADLVEDGGVPRRGASDLRVGDTVLVRSGSRVPADGRIVDGAASWPTPSG